MAPSGGSSSGGVLDAVLDDVLDAAVAARRDVAGVAPAARRDLLASIAAALEDRGDQLVAAADRETHLGEVRLTGELARTCGQLRRFADLVGDASWAQARIDSEPPGLRRMLVPIGVVAVFGASNFPLAFSVPGGDTASALAAGCPVVVKSHPAHPDTSQLAAGTIGDAVRAAGLPAGTFALVAPPIGADELEFGRRLVTDDRVDAVAFTGSLRGGRALFDAIAGRPRPVPFFGELGSVNPVFVLPRAATSRADAIAADVAASVTQGVGQFCTNPGVVVVADERLVDGIAAAMADRPAATMLTPGIGASYERGVAGLVAAGARLVAGSPGPGRPALLAVDADTFCAEPRLRAEVFGPASLVVVCPGPERFVDVAAHLDGQLTGTVIGDDDDLARHGDLLVELADKVGRLVCNGVPTGVAVSPAMQHGGPYPASTDSRTTSVGTAAIERFVRPVCYQGFPDAALPPLLRDANPLGAVRLVDGELTRAAVDR